MRERSLKETLPKLTGVILLLFLLLILPLNFWLQLHLLHQGHMESTKEIFSQLEQLIWTTEAELASEEQKFKEECIWAADMVAYHIGHTTGDINDLDYVRELAQKVDVDEIHFFTPEGRIFAGTHPQYYGYTFDSGEQMRFFLPMLEDRSLKLCQDIMPNTAEEKEMQYAAVWLEDESCIVQIGMEPWHLQKKIQEESLENIVSGMLFETTGYLHVFNRETDTIVASTSRNIYGRRIEEDEEMPYEDGQIHMTHTSFQGDWYCVYMKPYKNYILVRTYKSFLLIKDVLGSTVFVTVYVLLGGFGIIALLRWYVQKKLLRSMDRIIKELQKIETGSLDAINIHTGITELEELLFYINQMLNSLCFNRNQLKYILNQAEIPFGFFEINHFYNKSYANSRMMEILGAEDYDIMDPEKQYAFLERELKQAEKDPVSESEGVYRYYRKGEERYLQIKTAEDPQGKIYYVTDVTYLWRNVSRVREESQRDELTGLLNRRGLYEHMNRLFELEEPLGFAVMLMIDADGLKQINDIYGHFVGDQYLKRIAAAIEAAAGDRSVCARLGGDEFVIFLYGFSSMDALKEQIHRIGRERGRTLEGCIHTIQFSMGEAFYPADGTDFHILMKTADERMYQEKKARKEQ